jgi:cation diffusion facilitator CzcD-associated flavoprotein CzcO
VIGSGFGGLAIGTALRRSGREDFLLFERAADVGGTWRDNSYPGAACDVPSHLYSLSFAGNPGWTRSFPQQPELEAYLGDVADREGLRPHLRPHHDVLSSRWNEVLKRWEIETTAGPYTADILVSAAGALADAKIPALPGLDTFPGQVFHSSQWRHDVDLTGKRVAVIGTGASAIQFVPEIQPKVAALHLFQRTAPWLVPRVDRQLSALERRIYMRSNAMDKLARLGDYLIRELIMMPAFVIEPKLQAATNIYSRLHLRRQVKDPVLRKKLTPTYTIGCKRILISNKYFPAVAQPNVEVLTTGLASVEGSTVIGSDGVRREVDAIIFGTGFQVEDLPIAHNVYGRSGESLHDRWEREGMKGLRGTTFTDFPNFFMIVGPNTGLGHSSMVYIIESQVNYIMDALRQMDTYALATIEANPQAVASWNSWLTRRLDRTIWNVGGCNSWYQDDKGGLPIVWPASTFTFRQHTRTFDLSEYEYECVPSAQPVEASGVPAGV